MDNLLKYVYVLMHEELMYIVYLMYIFVELQFRSIFN